MIMKSKRLYGGFIDDKLATCVVNDSYGTHLAPAIFTFRKNAKEQYQDVRRIFIQCRQAEAKERA